MKNATSIKYHNNNSSVDSIGNDKSFESENELSMFPINFFIHFNFFF